MQPLFQNYSLKLNKARDIRSPLIQELYEFYTSKQERINRKKENWKRYVAWLKENKIPHSMEMVEKFKKQKKLYIAEIPIGSFCYLLSHIATKDLPYIVSVSKDKFNRGETVSPYILGSIKVKRMLNK